MGWMRFLILACAIILGLVILTVFLNLFLKIAALVFLVTFAYYWLMKAIHLRKEHRNW